MEYFVIRTEEGIVWICELELFKKILALFGVDFVAPDQVVKKE